MTRYDSLLTEAKKQLSESASTTTDIPWHRWSDDDSAVIGVLDDQGTFTDKEGNTRHFAVVTKEDGSRVRVGTDNAALRRLWEDKQPSRGDSLCIMRGTEMRQSSSGRDYWPYALAVESGQQQMDAGVPMSAPAPTMDPDDNIPF